MVDLVYAIMGGHIRVVTPEGKKLIDEIRTVLNKKGLLA